VLAGDHLKAASDLGVQLVGVGLFYRQGYFRQRLTIAGTQREEFAELDATLLPVTRVVADDGAPLRIEIPFPGATLHAGLWRVDVGRIALYLLDADVPENAPAEREVTDRLYGGDAEHRLRQEILLGIGGVRALTALGLEPEVFHTNEGHAGFLGVERMRRLIESGLDPATALEAVRGATVFTTHTPVPAGIDRFPRELVARYFGDGGVPAGIGLDALLGLGDEPGGDHSVFNMAVMGLRLAAHVNGVSRLHGAVSRGMFRGLWPGLDEDEVPIRHLTNGVHAGTWVGPEFDAIYRSRLGDGYGSNGHGFEALADVPDEALWAARHGGRERLVGEVRRRLSAQWMGRGARGAQLHWIGEVLDPDALTIGFARRVPTYKRLTLILRQRERLVRLLTDPDRPVQLVFAGKAHPHDGEGKRLIEELGAFAASPQVRHRVVMLADYDMALGRALVAGVDVWLNNPLRPFEAFERVRDPVGRRRDAPARPA
jgi:starch phosphorylase